MPDERYRFRGTVIQHWERDQGGMWQAHRCHWSGPETWPFTAWEYNRLLLCRWLYERNRLNENTTAVGPNGTAGLAQDRLRGGRFARRIGSNQ